MNKSQKIFVTTTCAAHRPQRAAVRRPWDRRREVRLVKLRTNSFLPVATLSCLLDQTIAAVFPVRSTGLNARANPS
jgi:hypothetical protein